MKETKEKYDLINKLLLDEYVLVQINTSVEGLVLPQHLTKDPSVTLKLSTLFRGGIEVTPERIEANLSFNQNLFMCIIPFTAIWSASSYKDETTVWPGSIPSEQLKTILDKQISESAQPARSAPALKKAPRPAPAAALNKISDSEDFDDSASEEPVEVKKPKSKPFLKRVK